MPAMRIAVWAGHALIVLVVGCAPSKDIESPADPPGFEKQDQSGQAEGSAESSASFEAEAEAEADTSEETGD